MVVAFFCDRLPFRRQDAGGTLNAAFSFQHPFIETGFLWCEQASFDTVLTVNRASISIALSLAMTVPGFGEGRNEASFPRVAADSSSYANVSAFITRHLILDLTADFDRRILAGSVELHFSRRDMTATELVLDTRDLAIEKAEAAAGTNALVKTTFNLDRATPIFGSALRIVMPPDTDRVRVT